jgi:hypothetical protein
VTRRAYHPPEAVERVRALAERALPVDEFVAWADGPISDEEMAENVALIRWFLRRYPTPAARLRYARRRQRELARTMAHAARR